jgi:hypothetical protein
MTTPACRGVCLFDYQLKCQKQREGGSNVLLAPRGKRINAFTSDSDGEGVHPIDTILKKAKEPRFSSEYYKSFRAKVLSIIKEHGNLTN